MSRNTVPAAVPFAAPAARDRPFKPSRNRPMTTSLETRIGRGEFVITAEIVPPLAGDAEKLLAEADVLRGKVHAINVTDAAAGRTSVSSFAAAAILAAHGHEPVVQVTCRDRNRIALAADLLGASAQGVRNVLALTGDDPAKGDQPEAKAVFDLTATELLELARTMRDDGTLPSGRAIDPPPRFFLGAADVPGTEDKPWQSSRLLAKLGAGAAFVQTQFCFELGAGRAYLRRLRDEGITERAAVLVGTGPLTSARSARWMNDNLYGVAVPDSIIARLEQAVDPAAEAGAAGVHLMTPGRGTGAVAELLETPGIPSA
jgi:methylenetetrahydrofolate reductase (NADPH)